MHLSGLLTEEGLRKTVPLKSGETLSQTPFPPSMDEDTETAPSSLWGCRA